MKSLKKKEGEKKKPANVLGAFFQRETQREREKKFFSTIIITIRI